MIASMFNFSKMEFFDLADKSTVQGNRPMIDVLVALVWIPLIDDNEVCVVQIVDQVTHTFNRVRTNEPVYQRVCGAHGHVHDYFKHHFGFSIVVLLPPPHTAV
jgi:hypothetical protein